MKKTTKLFGVIVLVSIIGFGLTVCSDGGGGGGTSTQPVFSVSGEFSGAVGKALFSAKTSETVSKSARSGVTTYELTGELEDGDMLFRLRGTYDSSTGSYTVSSASSFARYTIIGNKTSATATLAVLQNGEWQSFIVSVTIKDVSIKDGDAIDYAGGLPAWAKGSWYSSWSEDPSNYTKNSFEAWAYFDQWYYEAYRSSVWRGNWGFTATKYTVIKAEHIGNGVYDVIFSYPLYRATDAQKKTALENFFKEINLPAEFWNKKFDPWDRDVWTQTEGGNEGKNYDDSVIWYICMKGEGHCNSQPGGLQIINWSTFHEKVGDKGGGLWYIANNAGAEWWQKKEAVETFFTQQNISNYYYWGWFEAGWNASDPHESRAYSCWEPSCETDGNVSWWDKTRYYLKWGNLIGIQGDWDKHGHLFQKWTEDDYLVRYLRSQNVVPETWYTRARIWRDGVNFNLQYYNGDNEAAAKNHNAPACDTMSLTKIQALTFDPNYYEWSYGWSPQP
jgi:hypothetical protein